MANGIPRKSLIASVTVPTFAAQISNTILTLFLADIALTFFGNATPASVAVTGQLSSINSIAEAVMALLMGFLVVKFRHKALYLSGIFLVIVSAIGSFLAPTLLWMQVFYFLEGIGTMMTAIIAATIVGNLLVANKKGKVISYIVAAAFLSPLIGTPLFNLVAEAQGWRYNYLLFALPAAIVGLLIALYGVPFRAENPVSLKRSALSSFKKVFVNRSAVFCLLCQFFFVGVSISLYTLPFFRGQFGLARTAAGYILMTASGIYLLSSLVTGRLVNKLGAKNLVITGTFLDGIFITSIFLAPNLWTSLALNFSHIWFAGMAIASFSCLVLDQVPDSRGTMISLNRVFGKGGDALTPAVGGLVLLASASYGSLGLVLGGMSIIGAVMVLFFVRSPSTS